jgi:hypothetical protein
MGSTDLGNLGMWDVTDEAGDPVCVCAMNDAGLSITLYRGENGGIVGVLVYDDAELVSATGLVPAERLMEEVEYAKN